METMKSIQIKDSYRVWNHSQMRLLIIEACEKAYGSQDAEKVLNRSYKSMYNEWILHNIAYLLTKPLCSIPFFSRLNARAKDVDLEEHITL